MPLSAVRTFTDPDDYAAAIRATKAEMTVTGRGEFAAKLIRIDLHRLWMQRFSDNLPRIGHSAGKSGRAIISFRTQPGPSLLWGGAEMHPTNIIRHGEGESTFQRSSGSASWGAMSLPVEVAAAVGETLAGCDLMPPRNAMLITPTPSAMARLQRLHAAAGRLAEDAPEIIANPDAARGLEHELIEAWLRCLDARQHRETSLAQGQHADRHAPLPQGGGGESGTTALHPGDMQGDPGFGPHLADCAARSIWGWGQSATCCCAA